MTEKKVLIIDINAPTAAQGQKNSQGWSRSDNTFKFNFIPEGAQAPTAHSQEEAKSVHPAGSAAFTGQGSGFAFNFQIPEGTQGEMKTEEASPSEVLASDSHTPAKEEKLPPNEPPVSSKAKKKKKSGQKKTTSGAIDGQQKQTTSSSAAEGAEGDGRTALSAEEQLNRELDWCIEQLELRMNTQKCTPKQKEESSRALKTLRSSKAPLAKKRQVMRAMSGDYRKKMEEEKDKQFKLIQAAMTSAQVKAVSEPAKKSVFHRRADGKTQTHNSTQTNQQGTVQTETDCPSTSVQKQEETSTFVFTPAKEEFCFNFL